MTADWRMEARGLLDRATPGPWATEHDGVYTANRSYLVVPNGDSIQDFTDAELIAAAPTIIARALDVLDAIEAEARTGRNWHEPGKRPNQVFNSGWAQAMRAVCKILDGDA